MSFTGKVTQRSDNNPIYILTVEDPSDKKKIIYYLTSNTKVPMETTNYLDFVGRPIPKAMVESITKNPYVNDLVEGIEEVSIKIPWLRIIHQKNIVYKKPRPE